MSLFYSSLCYAVRSLLCKYGKTHNSDKFMVGGYPSISSLIATTNSKAEVLALCSTIKSKGTKRKGAEPDSDE